MARVKQIVGLDLGSRTLRAVWVHLQGDRPKILRVEKMALPIDGENNTKLTATWIEQIGLSRGFAAIAIPGTQLVFQPGRLAPGDPRTPKQAADMELVRFNDMVGDTMTSDVASHESSDGTRRYLMTMARTSVVSGALAGLEPISVRPTDLVPGPVALFNGLSPLNPSCESPCLYMDIGATQTEMAIGTSRGLLFARAFPFGGRPFTEALSRSEGIGMQQAENLKLRDGSLKEGTEHAGLLRGVADRWYAQFSAALAAYRSALSGPSFILSSIVISGGGSLLDGFGSWLEEKTGLPVRSASSLAEGKSGADPAVFAMAMGLAATSLEVPGLPRLSLIPEALRDEVVFRAKKPYWISAAVTFALALGVFTAGLVYALGREANQLAAERKELERRKRLDGQIQEIRKRTASIREQARPVRQCLSGWPASRRVLSLVANALSPDDWITLVCDENIYLGTQVETVSNKGQDKKTRPGFYVPGFAAKPVPLTRGPFGDKDSGNKAPAASDFTAFIIEGYTPDLGLDTVRDMLRRIRAVDSVKKVDLLRDDKVKPATESPEFFEGVSAPEMRRFVIRLEVSRP